MLQEHPRKAFPAAIQKVIGHKLKVCGEKIIIFMMRYTTAASVDI